jgi:hypothetical protein
LDLYFHPLHDVLIVQDLHIVPVLQDIGLTLEQVHGIQRDRAADRAVSAFSPTIQINRFFFLSV